MAKHRTLLTSTLPQYYEKNIDETLDTNNMLQDRLAGLQKLQKASDPNKLDSLKHY